MKKVLIVDDETSVRKLVAASLRKQSLEVFQAVNSREALRLTYREHPDLIVMDVVLPGMDVDGVELTRNIKKDPETGRTKVLLISGVVNVEDQRLVECGADGFLPKPFNPIKLRKMITKLLGLSSQPDGDNPSDLAHA